jgi:hypothetical protein
MLSRGHLNESVYKRVISGEISAREGMIESGRKKILTPFAAIQKLIPRLSKTERNKLIKLLTEYEG